MNERIQKILSSRGICSRRHAEELILAGRVSCNGTVCKLGDSADLAVDNILVDGKPIPSEEEHVYILLHKPRGYVTTLSDEKGRKNVSELVSCGKRVYPVGRLDMDSEGLLILTNDGQFANHLMHPKHNVNKVYRATVKNYSEECVSKLRIPIMLDGYKIKPPRVETISVNENGTAILEITIHEGRNRQVRRMCAAANMPVIRLVRVAEGSVLLGTLPCGKWRYLTEAERKALQD